MADMNITVNVGDDPDVRELLLDKLRAEIKKANFEATAQATAIRSIAADAERQELSARHVREEWDYEHARDIENHVFRFSFDVTDKSVSTTIEELAVWRRQSPQCLVEIVFNTPGGSLTAGMELYDYLQEMKRAGHPVITAARGYAASMGGILLQAGLPTPQSPKSKRVIGSEAYVMLHEPAAWIHGKLSEIEDESIFLAKAQERVLDLFVEGSQYAFDHGTSEMALSAGQFQHGDSGIPGVRGWSRREWWLDSEDCLRFGIVDEVR